MTNKITYYGSDREIVKAIAKLKHTQKKLEIMKEADARLTIQALIDKYHLTATIMINGNAVWSKDRILQNLERIIKHGTLYNENDKPPVLSQYFYQFLYLQCGSIAHTDVFGWVSRYPTLEALKKFFKQNEFGKPVRDWIPPELSDARAIVQAIEQQLFPFETYMREREKTRQ